MPKKKAEMSLKHLYRTSSTGESIFYSWFSAMHTRIDLIFHGHHSEEKLLTASQAIRQEIHRIEQIGNCFDESSELAYVNRTAYSQNVPLSEELYNILTNCKTYHIRTLGFFDVTIHSEKHTPQTIEHVKLFSSQRVIRYTLPGIHINLSGFLKGYALDCIRPILSQYNIHHALVNLGNSSILAIGNHPAGKGWKLDRGITLYDQCLTTSGNDKENRQHIKSPFTGEFIHGVRQINVITSDGTSGEVFSTALFAASSALQREELIQSMQPQLIHYYEIS